MQTFPYWYLLFSRISVSPSSQLSVQESSKFSIDEFLQSGLQANSLVGKTNQGFVLNAESDRDFQRVLIELRYVIQKAHLTLKGLTAGPIIIEGDFHLDNERKLVEWE